MFHLGWFTKFGPPAWQADSDRLHGGDWSDGRHFVDLARRLEAACFDLLFFEDTQSVARVMGGTPAVDLKHALYSPKHDPLALLAYLSAETERIGLVATASTSFYPPYLLARLLSTIDSLSRGRVGWNIVTSSLVDEAQNYGMEALPPGPERYDRADDFLEVAKKLWDAWEPGAVIRDVDSGVYADASKVHDVDHRGPYHSVRGPLNSQPSPQRRPVLAQAGASERGRDFAAKHAELIFAMTSGGVAVMKDLRDDLHRRMRGFGRDPAEAKIFWSMPIVITPQGAPGATPAAPEPSGDDATLEVQLAYWSAFLDLDLSRFDLDAPIPEDTVAGGHTSLLDQLKMYGRQGKSLREAVLEAAAGDDELGLIGPADVVARNLVATMDAVGGDGVMVLANDFANAAYVSSIVDELVPRLRELGAVRTGYSGPLLRDNLLAF